MIKVNIYQERACLGNSILCTQVNMKTVHEINISNKLWNQSLSSDKGDMKFMIISIKIDISLPSVKGQRIDCISFKPNDCENKCTFQLIVWIGYYLWFVSWCEATKTRLQWPVGSHQNKLCCYEFANDWCICYEDLADIWDDDCASWLYDSWRTFWWKNLCIPSSGKSTGGHMWEGILTYFINISGENYFQTNFKYFSIDT